MGSGAATAYPSNMIPPHTKAISKQNTLFRAPQHGRGCFVLAKNDLPMPPQCFGILSGNFYPCSPAKAAGFAGLPFHAKEK